MVDFKPYEEQIDAFKEKYIYSRIIREEMERAEFDSYIQTMESHMSSFRYLNKEGVLRPAVVGELGEGDFVDVDDVVEGGVE